MTDHTRPEETSTVPGADERDLAVPEFQRTPGKAEGEDPDDPQAGPADDGNEEQEATASDAHLVPPPPTEAG